MLVKDCMTRHPVMVSPETMASEARRVMNENKIRHLPVVGDGKRLAGLVTRQSFALQADNLASLDMWELTRRLGEVTVGSIMVPAKKVLTTEPNETAERAAKALSENKYGCLPVVEDGIVVGIVTETDLLETFQLMLGLPVPGLRVTIRMPDRPGEFAKLTAVLGENHIAVMGIGTFPSPKIPGYYDAVLKIRNVTMEKVKSVLSGIPDQEIIDLRDVN
jgi:acetoin utilization protein AcuB